jgi:hypothetical protein
VSFKIPRNSLSILSDKKVNGLTKYYLFIFPIAWMGSDGVHFVHWSATLGPIVPGLDDDDDEYGEVIGMRTGRGN